MKGVFVVCLMALVGVAYGAPEKYTTKYDNIDFQEIIDNDRLLNPYIMCLLDKGKCTSEGKELKSHIPDALQTDCSKCSPTQSKEANHFIGHIITKKPKIWQELKAKFDPTGQYEKNHEAELRNLKSSA